ncbi:MAG TPA: class I SAM-dependent methyltransferase [Anaerolineales bacterium]|nr:class I SAM-dependent methyltransferase [Anaerolineales bacterium]
MMKCKICNFPSSPFGEAKILNKHLAHYFRCENCGFIHAETPYWLEEAYSKAITKSDIGMLGRNLEMMRATKNLILMCFDPASRFIDYGGGYGVFVRLMRDEGFDFYRHDPLCENLFAVGFEAQSDTDYELLTAWEVFEHLVDPLAEIEKMLGYSNNIFFSTILLPQYPKPLDEWWYYGLEHGQHVSFYSRETLQFIAQKYDLGLVYSDGTTHLMGTKPIHPLKLSLTFGRYFSLFRRILLSRSPVSLLKKDFQQITGQTLNNADLPERSRK